MFTKIKEAAKSWSRNHTGVYADSASYNMLLVFPSLILFVLYIVKIILIKKNAVDETLQLIQNALPKGAGDILSQFTETTIKFSGFWTAAVSLAVLLFSASKLFYMLEKSFNHIFQAKLKASAGIKFTIRQKLISFGLTIFLAFIFILSTSASSALSYIPSPDIIYTVLNYAISFALLTLFYATLYKTLLHIKISFTQAFKHGLFLATITAAGIQLLSLIFGLIDFQSGFSIGSSIILLVVWINFMMKLILFGVELSHQFMGSYSYKEFAHKKRKINIDVQVSTFAKIAGAFKLLIIQFKTAKLILKLKKKFSKKDPS